MRMLAVLCQALLKQLDMIIPRGDSIGVCGKLVPQFTDQEQLFFCREIFQFGDALCDHSLSIGFKERFFKTKGRSQAVNSWIGSGVYLSRLSVAC